MEKYYFTSEAVTEGHPDKICDLISDAILDAALKEDEKSKMAVEVTIKDDLVLIYGETKTTAKIDYESIAKKVIRKIGYDEEFNVITKISEQSKEISDAVEKDITCAGDQGIMFGYACDETKELMPTAIVFANKLAKRLADVRKCDVNTPLKPDGKTQVTIEYVDGNVNRVDTIIISSQHKKGVSIEELRDYIIKNVINEVIPKNLIDNATKILINTSGSFVVGGPFGDSGTTGRKIICDTYGGYSSMGGGCLSSKDSAKVDRSAAYYARYVAKNVVAHNLAGRCEIQVSYAIGISKPISLFVETFNTSKVTNEEILKYINNNFDFSVYNIIRELDLLKPIYFKTACYGHFGREDEDFSWEKIKN